MSDDFYLLISNLGVILDPSGPQPTFKMDMIYHVHFNLIFDQYESFYQQ